MIAFDLTQETPASATGLIVEPKGDKSEGSLSFSALLKGIKESDKIVENSAFVISLDDVKKDDESLKGSKNNLLLSLMSEDTQNVEDEKLLEINPEIKSSLSTEDLKQLVQDAKSYLKKQILSSDGFKRSEVDKLPKTLQGLADAAKKIGIDISKITLEEVSSQNTKSNTVKEDTALRVKNSDTKEIAPQKQEKSTISITPEVTVKAKNSKKIIQTNSTQESADTRVSQQVKIEQKTVSKETTPQLLFKEQNSTPISTQQIVTAKAINTNPSELQTSKKRTDDTLKLLLRGEQSVKQKDSLFTADFSVATAKVIAPTATNEASKSLESLLNPEMITDDKKSDPKTETLHVAKADSFEVKLNEAKQMVKYLSADVKQAIDNYKAPFTRIKVQLNPQQLGDIELTVVQRGKNLHVNLSSNNAAINTLSMHANDLKVQLQNSGINNASLNFSNNSQGGEQAASQQQQQQNRQNAQSEYNYFENEEQNEEILSSLEIVVPNYA